MTRGIRLKTLTDTDLGHLGLPPGTLQGGIDLADGDQTPDAETIAIAREVRRTLESVFDILTEALPADRG